jgi:hypothetical protein
MNSLKIGNSRLDPSRFGMMELPLKDFMEFLFTLTGMDLLRKCPI